MFLLRQSTASQEIPLGYFVDSTDGDTAETALTIANTDIKLWKSGATSLANKNSGGATHMAGGLYYAVLDATDSGTVGPMKVFVHVAGALSVCLECLVLPANVYDSIVGSDLLDTNIAQAGGSGTVGAGALPNAAAAANGGLPTVNGSNYIAGIQGAVNVLTNLDIAVSTRLAGGSITLSAGAVTVGTNSDKTGYALSAGGVTAVQSGLATAASLDIVDDFLDTEIAAIKAKTDNLPSDPADASDIAASFTTVNTTLGTIAAYIDTEVAAIKAKTDQLTFTNVLKVDASIQAAGDFAQAAADKAWGTAARTLTAFGFSVTVGTNSDKAGYTLSGAGVTAVQSGLATAASLDVVDDFLDTEVAAIKAKTDTLPASYPANFGSLSINSSGQVVLSEYGLDAVSLDLNYNARKGLSLILSAQCGSSTFNPSTGVFTIYAAGGTTARITGTGNGYGARSAITLTPPS